MNQRVFSPLELNHLRKHGFPDVDLKAFGEKPVEYITGHADFCGLDFLVNEHTLIPRLESEKIIQIAFNHILSQNIAHPIIADIGTGSGCLGLSLVFKLQKNEIPYSLFLSDTSATAINTARENTIRVLPSPANIFFEKSDLLESYPKIKLDLVLANLPYIPSGNIPSLPSSVKDFEPRSALDGGPQGTTLINRLIHNLPEFLSEKGIAIIELNDTHSQKDFPLPPSLSSTLEKDSHGKSRFLLIYRHK